MTDCFSPSQAGYSETQVPPPNCHTHSLPFTGFDPVGVAIVGIVALAAGVAAWRKSKPQAADL